MNFTVAESESLILFVSGLIIGMGAIEYIHLARTSEEHEMRYRQIEAFIVLTTIISIIILGN